MERGAWRATVHRVAKSRKRLKQFSMHTCPRWVILRFSALDSIPNVHKIPNSCYWSWHLVPTFQLPSGVSGASLRVSQVGKVFILSSMARHSVSKRVLCICGVTLLEMELGSRNDIETRLSDPAGGRMLETAGGKPPHPVLHALGCQARMPEMAG